MAEVFDALVAGYFQSFGNLTSEQTHCRQFTIDHLDELTSSRQREKYLQEVVVCIGGFSKWDEEEPLEPCNFSQYQFYQPFTFDLVFYVDKFDFLIKCIAKGVCRIAGGFEERYEEALINAMTFRAVTTPEKPQQVLELRTVSTPRTVKEMNLSEEEQAQQMANYVTKHNSFNKKVKDELAALEQEQFAAEKARGEHPSVMGWEEREAEAARASRQTLTATEKRELVEAELRK